MICTGILIYILVTLLIGMIINVTGEYYESTEFMIIVWIGSPVTVPYWIYLKLRGEI